MNKFKQILVSAIIAVLLAITFFFLIGEPESEIVGIIAFILMILHYRKKNKEGRRKAEEEERQKAEAERKRKEEEKRQKAEAERKRKEEEERQKAEAERKRKEEEESFDWDYDQSSQTLTISGQGHMPNDWHPWGTLYVKRIILKDGITSISENAFSSNNLNARHEPLRIDFGNTLQEIKDRAFYRQSFSNGSYVLPASLLTIGDKAFESYNYEHSVVTFCFRSQEPPSLKGNPFQYLFNYMLIIPTGCLKKYLTLSCWQERATIIKEKDVSLMHSFLELEAIEAENRHKAEEEKKRLKEERIKKAEEEEKKRLEEERIKKAEEEKKRLEEERIKKAEEEEYKAKYEAELRKKMGL